jgi:excinuclease ABC subunit C
VGRATTLRSRVGSYWSDLRGRRHLTRMVAQVARIEAVACGSVHEAAWLERNLLETAMPRWNRTPGGQENRVYIRLSRQPSARALTVVYERPAAPRVQYFGPYLGGVRAGRLCQWSQRPCPQRAAAEPALAATPAGWAAFATRNAELAATLTRIAPLAG